MRRLTFVLLERTTRTGAACLAALTWLTAGACVTHEASSGTTRFVLDGNRMYAELSFIQPHGAPHRALAFVDMGSPSLVLRESLFNSLQLDRTPLVFKVGALSVEVPRADVTSEHRDPASIGSDLKVEGILPASILQRYQVVIDYRQQTLTLALPRTLTPDGVPVPFHINRATGLISVDAAIDGRHYSITIDNGSAYTWFRPNAAIPWATAHPEWVRGVGAVGAANMMMSGDGTETSGTLLRIPEVSLGPLTLRDVGALAVGPGRPVSGSLDLFDWYSQKNAGPVVGWIGGNVLKTFRLTMDYPNHMTYWHQQRDAAAHDLDQVGLTLRSNGGAFVVAAIATKNGHATVDGVLPGDVLVRVDSLETRNATWGAIYEALHGRPGEARALVLERNGSRVDVTATVTAF